ncbi:hypothetical protein D3C85_13570 [compost metagenome]
MSQLPFVQYPLDLDGTSPTNHIVGEVRDIENNLSRIFVPSAGPFFTESFKIFNDATGEPLRPVDDYLLVQPFQQASLRSGKDVQCAVLIKLNAPIRVRMDFRVIGGEYSWNLGALVALIEQLNLDDRPIKWGSVLGRPTAYPAAPHIHDIGDTFGWEYVVWQLERITNAILIGDEASHDELRAQILAVRDEFNARIAGFLDLLQDHTTDITNPHKVTKTQVGLGSVDNYSTASDLEGTAGVVTNRFMTPHTSNLLAQKVADAAVNEHEIRKDNPHVVTKAQVGLGNVDNFMTATKVEAEAGIVSTRFMTPLATRQAIDAVAIAALNSHAGNTNNPHHVTKAQVGLSNVDNYIIAAKAEAEAGSLNTRFMSPLRTKEAITYLVGNALTTHVANTSNPHNVTKAQVGLGNVDNFPISNESEAEAGTVNNRFMTPWSTRQAIDAVAIAALNAHTANKNNPHVVTKAQVGLGSVDNFLTATKAEAEAGALNTRFMTPLRTKEAITYLVGNALTAHTANMNNPHGVTKTQVGLGSVDNFPTATKVEAEAGVLNTRFMTPLTTRQAIDAVAIAALNAHAAKTSNPHNVTKAQVGLGNVDNYIIAAKTEAEAGALNTRFMTPLRTKEAITYIVGNALSAHVANMNNPHQTTAAQVGAYTTAATDSLLNGKLGKTETAANSTKLGGNTLTQVLTSAYDAIGSMGKRNVFISTADPAAGNGVVGDVWLKY